MRFFSFGFRGIARLGAIAFSLPLLAGCSADATLSASLSPHARTRLADNLITDAVAAFNKGNQGAGDAALGRAVVLLSGTLGGDFRDEGFLEVARRISAKGRPADAVRLLEPLTSDQRVSGDPRLWATLARAARKSGNARAADENDARAKREAGVIVAGFGSAAPGSAAAIKGAEAALQAGQYFKDDAKEPQRALLAFREAHRLLPQEPTVSNALGYALAEEGTTLADFTEAVQLTRAVVAKVPGEASFLDSFGWALFKRGDKSQLDYDGARRLLREALGLAPDLPECRYHLAVVYEKMGALRDALGEAERAAILNPDYAEARVLADRLRPLVAALPSPSPSASPTPGARATPSVAASP